MKRGHSFVNLKSYQNMDMDENTTTSDVFKRPHFTPTTTTTAAVMLPTHNTNGFDAGDDDGYCSVRQMNTNDEYLYDYDVTSEDLLKNMDDKIIEELYKEMYKPARLPKFVAFTYVDAKSAEDGIPRRAALFQDMDFANYPNRLERYSGKLRKATINDYCHILNYLMSDCFVRDIFKTRKYDHILNAMVSFLFDWDFDSLVQLNRKYRITWRLIDNIIKYQKLDNGAYIYSFYGLPVCKVAIKILKSYFEDPIAEVDRNVMRVFEWSKYIDPKMIEHFRSLERHIENGQPITSAMRDELMENMDIPYKLPNIDLEGIRGVGPLKFISGVACSGKTTILNKLRDKNWKIFSRGDVGSFGGKANNAPTIATLHAALEFVLTQSDVIGDRGPIDNPLWTIIMELCDPSFTGSIVIRILEYFNSNFNEPSIAYFVKQCGVIFLDTNFKANAGRMIVRNLNGDAHRSRLDRYAMVQFIAYYIALRLFGWKPQCVPYDDFDNFAPQEYASICTQLHKYFCSSQASGVEIPKKSALPYVRFAKPTNKHISNMTFPKAVGIFK